MGDKKNPATAAKNRYNAKAYDRIVVVVRKGKKDIIKKAASKAKESVNTFITTAIDDRMKGGGKNGV